MVFATPMALLNEFLGVESSESIDLSDFDPFSGGFVNDGFTTASSGARLPLGVCVDCDMWL